MKKMKDVKISFGSYGAMLIFLLLVWLTKSNAVFVIGWILEALSCLVSFAFLEILVLAFYGKLREPFYRLKNSDLWILGAISVVLLAISCIPLALYHVVSGILMQTPGI